MGERVRFAILANLQITMTNGAERPESEPLQCARARARAAWGCTTTCLCESAARGARSAHSLSPAESQLRLSP